MSHDYSTSGFWCFELDFCIRSEKIIFRKNINNYDLKKIKISSQLTIFLLFGIVVIFVSLIFFTFKALLILGLVYLTSIPASYFSYKRTKKKLSKIKAIHGSAMFINKKNYTKIGKFDENFFLYLENDDLCLRKKNENNISI